MTAGEGFDCEDEPDPPDEPHPAAITPIASTSDKKLEHVDVMKDARSAAPGQADGREKQQ